MQANNIRELLSAFPNLPTLLVQSQHALITRLYELLDEDLETEDLPNLTAVEEEFPSLMKFLYDDPPMFNQHSASQLCQLTADLYTLAARHFWEDGE
ncbi:MAG: hypothetical protein KC445_18535 [Anaerolineales bacterium]|nr:hypothetical protein [Anaerolineales bacterium]MCB8929386.1 hypothetical protein [Ardenticatenaceae bacterium]MCB8948067.1 hypothetical protein [Ardenticatenaceae bacterium]